ncbi:uncharacterized protein METZ01_LOCUS171646 [marine metagenome]|uniref:Uncharacterized protein n=1 Tax=marine metagenome TaxID=408172 RepID=A0A382BZ31_9ZZZZ|tara:strand:- start:228 stop:692 length:465 start_codon:yes stop_codon:yes gene_type:complete
MRELSNREIFLSIDTDSKNIWNEYTDDERTQIIKKKFWLLNRYISLVNGKRDSQEWAVIATNELYNKNWAVISKHYKLLWQLLCCTHDVKRKTRSHGWIPLKKKGSSDTKTKFLLDLYPNKKQDEVELLANISTKAELQQLAQDLGYEKRDVKF